MAIEIHNSSNPLQETLTALNTSAGGRGAHVFEFTKEELKEYGIGTIPELSKDPFGLSSLDYWLENPNSYPITLLQSVPYGTSASQKDLLSNHFPEKVAIFRAELPQKNIVCDLGRLQRRENPESSCTFVVPPGPSQEVEISVESWQDYNKKLEPYDCQNEPNKCQTNEEAKVSSPAGNKEITDGIKKPVHKSVVIGKAVLPPGEHEISVEWSGEDKKGRGPGSIDDGPGSIDDGPGSIDDGPGSIDDGPGSINVIVYVEMNQVPTDTPPAPTATETPTQTTTPTSTPTPSETPTGTVTPVTETPTPSETPTGTVTPVTETPTPSETPTGTVTPVTETPTPFETPTPTPSLTPPRRVPGGTPGGRGQDFGTIRIKDQPVEYLVPGGLAAGAASALGLYELRERQRRRERREKRRNRKNNF